MTNRKPDTGDEPTSSSSRDAADERRHREPDPRADGAQTGPQTADGDKLQALTALQPKKSGLAGLIDWVQRSRPMRANTHLSAVGGSVFSAGMSFQALFAVFAALWVGFSVFGIYLRGNKRLLDMLLKQLDTLVPGLFGQNGAVKVDELIHGSAITWSSAVAAVSLIFLVITWFTSTRTTVRIIFGLESMQYKNAILLKLRDLGLAFIFGLLLVLSAVLTIVGSTLMNSILSAFGVPEDSWVMGWVGALVRYGVLIGIDMCVIFLIHRLLAEVQAPRKQLWLGSLIGALAMFVIKVLGTSLLGGATKNPLLASFAVIIGMLIWFNLLCRVLLFTSSWIAVGRDKSIGLPVKLADEDRLRRERLEAFVNAGIDPQDAEGVDATLLEPYARMNRNDD
jgi:membrane protein